MKQQKNFNSNSVWKWDKWHHKLFIAGIILISDGTQREYGWTLVRCIALLGRCVTIITDGRLVVGTQPKIPDSNEGVYIDNGKIGKVIHYTHAYTHTDTHNHTGSSSVKYRITK